MNNKHQDRFQQLGLNIAHYRKLRGMNQLQLAEAAGLSRTHISNIEAPGGNASVSLAKLFDIADALDIPVKLLFEFHDI